MELSYPIRRRDITEKGYVGVTYLFAEYPLLQDYEQVRSIALIIYYYLHS